MLPIDNKLEKFLDSNRAHEFVAILIIINACVLGAETYASMPPYLSFLHTIDSILLGIFLLELALRIFAGSFRFFKCGWNLFDMATILISVVSTFPALSAFRVVRIIRVMRLISIFPQMRLVISAIYMAIPGILSVACLLFMMFYIFSVIAYNLFHGINPQLFSSLGGSMYTLFQLMLCDEWANITRPILEKMPYSWLFFIPFIVIMTFSMLNLFFGLIVNAMQRAADKENEEALVKRKKTGKHDVDELSSDRDRMEALEAKVDALLLGMQSLTKRSDT
jgi:voltage-gated sodium channel